MAIIGNWDYDIGHDSVSYTTLFATTLQHIVAGKLRRLVFGCWDSAAGFGDWERNYTFF